MPVPLWGCGVVGLWGCGVVGLWGCGKHFATGLNGVSFLWTFGIVKDWEGISIRKIVFLGNFLLATKRAFERWSLHGLSIGF